MNAYQQKVRQRFNNERVIWPEDNSWSSHSAASIEKLVHEALNIPSLNNNVILNAGSGGSSYNLKEENIIHYDIVAKRLPPLNSVLGTVERMPFESNFFSHTICVGSVLNYCDPLLAIRELARVTNKEGIILMDYDSSCSWEFVGTKDYCKSSTFVETFYNNEVDEIFTYSHKYIEAICKSIGLQLLKRTPYHIISPLAYRITRNEKISGTLGYLDIFLNKIPIFTNKAATITLLCQKA